MIFFYILLLLFCLSFVTCGDFGLAEGSSCSWNGINGQCVEKNRCLSAVHDIANDNHPPICSKNEESTVICCTDCDLVDDTRLLLLDPYLGILKKSGTNKAKDKCLEYIHNLDYPCKWSKDVISSSITFHDERNCTMLQHESTSDSVAEITGGVDALRRQYPHMALLGFGETEETAQWLCGGTVISEKFVLTAGHCLASLSEGPVRYIGLGILKRTDPPEIWQRYTVKRIIPHSEYKPPSKYHDIALLETDKEISFNKDVRPACLHVDDRFDEYALATGWGAVGDQGALADTLQAATLQKFSDEECSGFYQPYRHLKAGYNQTTQVCYGDIKDALRPADTCSGDSGGPLQSSEHEQCVFTILGVTSFGRQCGERGGTGMYTRVAHYVSWIEDVVWPEE